MFCKYLQWRGKPKPQNQEQPRGLWQITSTPQVQDVQDVKTSVITWYLVITGYTVILHKTRRVPHVVCSPLYGSKWHRPVCSGGSCPWPLFFFLPRSLPPVWWQCIGSEFYCKHNTSVKHYRTIRNGRHWCGELSWGTRRRLGVWKFLFISLNFDLWLKIMSPNSQGVCCGFPLWQSAV